MSVDTLVSAKCDGECLGAGAQEDDLNVSIVDRGHLTDQLIHAFLAKHSVAERIGVTPMGCARRASIDEDPEGNARAAYRCSHDDIDADPLSWTVDG